MMNELELKAMESCRVLGLQINKVATMMAKKKLNYQDTAEDMFNIELLDKVTEETYSFLKKLRSDLRAAKSPEELLSVATSFTGEEIPKESERYIQALIGGEIELEFACQILVVASNTNYLDTEN